MWVRPQGEGEPVRPRQERCHCGFRHPKVSQHAPHRATGIAVRTCGGVGGLVVGACGERDGRNKLGRPMDFCAWVGEEGVAKSSHSQMETSIEICVYNVQNDRGFTGDVACGGDRTT